MFFCLILGSFRGWELVPHILNTASGMDASHLCLIRSSQVPLTGATVLSPYL